MLKLTKDKKITSDSHGLKEVNQEDILGYIFSEPVGEIDGWTLRDLFNFIEPCGMILGEMAWCNFDVFFKEMQKPVVPKDGEVDNVEYILVSRRIDLYKGEMNEYADVCGGNDTITDEQINEEVEKTGMTELSNRYAIEFTPVNELADKPIRIDDRFVVRKDIMDDNTMPVVFEARKPFYLLDIIWAILWEISFMGTPEDRDAKMDELDATIKGIKDGTIETIPAEEVFARLRERIDAAIPVTETNVERLRELTEGVEVDLNEPLDPANE